MADAAPAPAEAEGEVEAKPKKPIGLIIGVIVGIVVLKKLLNELITGISSAKLFRVNVNNWSISMQGVGWQGWVFTKFFKRKLF